MTYWRSLIMAVMALGGVVSGCSAPSSSALGEILGVPASTPVATPPAQVSQGTTLNIIGGNYQNGAPSTTFTDPLRIQLLNDGVPDAGKTVYFGVAAGAGGTLSAASATTDASGMAQVSYTAGGVAGATTVRATYSAFSADFTLTTISQAGTQIAILSGNAQTAAVGATLASPLTIQVTNAGTGLPSPGVLVRFAVATNNGRLNSSQNFVNLTTDGAGIASANFDVGTAGGANTVTASIVSVPAQIVTFTATGSVPTTSAVSMAQSAVAASVASISADGASTFTVTLTTRDAYGNTIPIGGKTIVFSTNAGTLLGSVTDHNNGTYSQLIRAPADLTAIPIRISGTVNAAALSSAAASVSLLAGSISLADSTVTTSSTSVVANGTNTVLVSVTLKDGLGNQLTNGGQVIAITATTGTLIGSVSDNGNGTYTQTYRTPTTSGSATISATVGGVAIPDQEVITLTAGPAVASRTTLQANPSAIAPNGVSSSVLTIQTKDIHGNPVSTGGLNVQITRTGGTWQGGGAATTAATDNGDGTYTKTLISAASSGVSTLSATLGGVAISNSATVYFSDGTTGPNIGKSLVDVVGTSIAAADNSTTTQIKVTLRDGSNRQLAGGGSTVTIASTAGTFIGSVTDHGDGTYTQLLRSPASAAANAVISATVDGQTITDTASISFYGPISLSQSDLVASPVNVEADGVSSTMLILTAKDANGTMIPVGGETGITFSATAGTLSGSSSDNGNGTYTQSLVAGVAAVTAVVTASRSGSAFSDTASVDFFVPNNLAGVTIDCGNIATYKNTHLLVSGGTLTLNTRSAAGYCPSDFVFASVTARGSGAITHSATTPAQEYGLEFSANAVSIDASSSIHANGKGYSAPATNNYFRVQGNQEVLNRVGDLASYSGGSHGGLGAGPVTQNANKTYGSIFQPVTMGASGGGSVWGAVRARAGGGQIKITVLNGGSLTNHGNISANGENPPDDSIYSLGAGGSIWITTHGIEGSGVIEANGAGALTYLSDYLYPGGGGRVALYYTSASGNFTTANVTSSVRAYGGTVGFNDSYRKFAAAGTVYVKSASQTYGDLIIRNAGRVNSSTLARTIINGPSAGTPDSLTSTVMTKSGAFADTFANINPFVGWHIDPNTTQNGTATKSDNALFKVTSGDQNSVTASSGGMTSVGNGTQSAELMMVFDSVDMGEGALVETAARILALKGDLSSQDNSTVNINGLAPRTLEYAGAGNFTMDVLGRSFPSWFEVFSITGDLTLNSGTYSFGSALTVPGQITVGSSTITGTDFTAKSFAATNSTLTGDSITTTLGNVTLTGSTATLGKPNGTLAINSAGNLVLSGASILQQKATTAATEYSMEIQASGVTVGAGAKITATGRGYTLTGATNGFRGFGNQIVPSFNGSFTTHASGGSHGGRGGSNHPDAYKSNEVYGSYYNPYTSGASGGGWSVPKSGGGIVRIMSSTGTVQVDGVVEARGDGAPSASSVSALACGAGGSIYIAAATVTGSGSLSADGGGGGCDYGDGGGGRVAVHYDTLSGGFAWPSGAIAKITAFGGKNSEQNYRSGGAGTVFLKAASETYGKLVINNNNTPTLASYVNENFSRINVPANSVSDALTAVTLTKGGHFVESVGYTGHLEGMWFNPNTAQNATSAVSDDTLFKIASHTTGELTSPGNLTSIGAAGNTFRIHPVFDSLRIINGAVLQLDSVIYTRELDVTGGAMTGTGSIALNTSGSYSIAGGAPVFSELTVGQNLSLSGAAEVSVSQTNIGGDLNITGAGTKLVGAYPGTSNITPNVIVGGDVNLTSGGRMVSKTATATTEYYLYLIAANLNIDATSAIDVTGHGYRNVTSQKFRSLGNVDVINKIGTGSTAAGATHGGEGGSINGGHFGNATYGNFAFPIHLGTSGPCWGGGANCGVHGGGAVRLGIAGTLTLDGTIAADGMDEAPGERVAAAGGSVLIETQTIQGTGTIRANGGLSALGSLYGAGGGGRVALYYTNGLDNFGTPSLVAASLKAYGGSGSNASGTAAAGTVFFKKVGDTYGNLSIDNGGRLTGLARTMISNTTSATVGAVTSGAITISGGFPNFYNGLDFLRGLFINPKTTQNASSALDDDTIYPIASNTVNSLTIGSGDPSLLAGPGDPFKLVIAVDNLDVRGSAKLDFGTHNIYSVNGDITSGNADFSLDGTIYGGVVDVGVGNWTETANGVSTGVTKKCAGNLASCN